jgi:hypothetical protein
MWIKDGESGGFICLKCGKASMEAQFQPDKPFGQTHELKSERVEFVQYEITDNPDTDWHAEAQMYADVVGKIKAFCDTEAHEVGLLNRRGELDLNQTRPCQCIKCQIKRRVLRIISDNLK